MGLFDNIQMNDYESPEMARSMAMLNLAGILGTPMQHGENVMTKLTQGALGGLGTYISQMEKLKQAKLDTEQNAISNRYKELQMKKLEEEIGERSRKEKSVRDWLDEATGYRDETTTTGYNEGTGENTQETRQVPITRREKFGDLADLLEYQGRTGLTLPGELYKDRYDVDVDGRTVSATNKMLIDMYLKQQELDYKKNKKTVRGHGYGEEAVYDSQGNVLETRKIPVKPQGAGSIPKGKNSQAVRTYLEKRYSEEGRKFKRRSAKEQAAFEKIARDAESRTNAGMDPDKAVEASISAYHDNYKKNKPQPTAGVIKTPNGTARIVK